MDNKFVNAYIDTAVGVLHEYLGNILQLKANLKVMQDVVAENEKKIAELEKKLDDTTKGNDRTVIDLKKQLNELITEANDLRSKASHVDTFAKNITQLKEQIKERDGIIVQLEEQLKKFDVEVQFEDEVVYELDQEPISILPINKEKKKPKKPDDDF